ncbi:sigma 54-interacting transcriptional regulator [bacterium]|nr:sigma 54-interacting transcriptional regulator [candidate division CSSED10-310 bacterium]
MMDDRRVGIDEIRGVSSFTAQMQTFAGYASNYLGPMLFRGEYGTGREFLARIIHSMSSKDRGYFLKIRCHRLQRLADWDLTVRNHLLLFCAGRMPLPIHIIRRLIKTGCMTVSRELAGRRYLHTGRMLLTLFFDEVGFLDPQLQNAMYYIVRSGEQGPIQREVKHWRIVFASSYDLASQAHSGQFSSRLYDEINGLSLDFPPLRDRTSDIPALAYHFLNEVLAARNRAPGGFSEASLDFLLNYSWPGNVGELKMSVARACGRLALTSRLLDVTAFTDLVRQSRMIDLRMGVG